MHRRHQVVGPNTPFVPLPNNMLGAGTIELVHSIKLECIFVQDTTTQLLKACQAIWHRLIFEFDQCCVNVEYTSEPMWCPTWHPDEAPRCMQQHQGD